MIKFLINLFKGKKENRVQKHYRKLLTYTFKDEDNRFVTKTIEDVEIVIKETSYGKSCSVMCKDHLTKEEVMAIIGMFI